MLGRSMFLSGEGVFFRERGVTLAKIRVCKRNTIHLEFIPYNYITYFFTWNSLYKQDVYNHIKTMFKVTQLMEILLIYELDIPILKQIL